MHKVLSTFGYFEKGPSDVTYDTVGVVVRDAVLVSHVPSVVTREKDT